MCQALKLCPWASTFNAQLLSNRGACNLKLNNYDKVIEDCSAALDLLPGYVKALLHRARAYLQLESYADAATDLERVVALDPSQASSLAKDIAQVHFYFCYFVITGLFTRQGCFPGSLCIFIYLIYLFI